MASGRFQGWRSQADPETTKNREGRVFPMTDDLRALLESRHAEHQRLKLKGQIVPSVFFRMVATKRGGPKEPRSIRAFTKAWAAACRAAGCPGRIPHDLRRTAVRNMVRRRRPRTRRDAARRSQDALSVRPLQHRVEWRSPHGRRAAPRADRDKKGTVRDTFGRQPKAKGHEIAK